MKKYRVKHGETVQDYETKSQAINAAVILYNKHYAKTGERVRAKVEEVNA